VAPSTRRCTRTALVTAPFLILQRALPGGCFQSGCWSGGRRLNASRSPAIIGRARTNPPAEDHLRTDARLRAPLPFPWNESSRPDFYSSDFMERRGVLGSSVWSTRCFVRWAAGKDTPRCWRLYSKALPIRTRYAGMATGYPDVDRRRRRSGADSVRYNGNGTSAQPKGRQKFQSQPQ